MEVFRSTVFLLNPWNTEKLVWLSLTNVIQQIQYRYNQIQLYVGCLDKLVKLELYYKVIEFIGIIIILYNKYQPKRST